MMKDIVAHPLTFISQDLVDMIRVKAPEAERLKTLHPDQLAIIFSEGWFDMFVPEAYGGKGLALPEGLRIEEGLSYADGSTAWVVTLCSGAAWFSGFIDPSILREIFKDEKVCFAGSGGATGRAIRCEGGYQVNGFWKYASGSRHATVFTANCVIEENGNIQRDADGSPRVRPFLFYKHEVTLHPTWHAMGMIATGSEAFEIRELQVPVDRCFTINAHEVVIQDPLYLFPFLQLAETTLTVNLSGMATRFIDLCAPLFNEKMQRAHPQDLEALLADARLELNQCRARFYRSVERAWQICQNRETISKELLDEMSAASHILARTSVALVDCLFPICGLRAADTREEINRVWRNIHTAGQHALFERMAATECIGRKE